MHIFSMATSCNLRKFLKIKTITLTLLGLFFFANCNVLYAYTNEIQNKDEKSSAKYLIEIENYTQDYMKDEAYDLIIEALSKINPENKNDKRNYMEILSYAIFIENNYSLYDSMIQHAIELYNLSDTKNLAHYRMNALYLLSYYDYVVFNNNKVKEKMDEMLLLPIDDTRYPKMIYYYRNLALLALDSNETNTAIQYYEKAYSLSKSIETTNEPDLQAVLLYDLGVAYEWKNEYNIAIKFLIEAIESLNPQNIDYQYVYRIKLAYYYQQTDQLDLAGEQLEQAEILYDKTNTLFKTKIGKSSYYEAKALYAYSLKDYKTAADHFFDYLTKNVQSSTIESSISAQSAASEFELSSIKEQINLLESYQQAQKRNLMYASIAIVLLISFIGFALMSFYRQNIQKKILYKMSITDSLTQLFNRNYIIDVLEKNNKPIQCIALLDIDHFKDVNDTFGHLMGDTVLKKVSSTIKNSIRPQDFVGRYGGEEFLILIDTDSSEIAQQVAERIRSNVEQMSWANHQFKITISIGVAMSSKVDSDLLLAEADSLLYQAKNHGRNRIEFGKFA